MKYSILPYFFTLLFLSIGCSDNNDPTTPDNCSAAFTESFEAELEAVTTASQNYSMNPTTANCQAFKDAYIKYLDALDEWEECAKFYNQVTQWEQAIEVAKSSVDSIIC